MSRLHARGFAWPGLVWICLVSLAAIVAGCGGDESSGNSDTQVADSTGLGDIGPIHSPDAIASAADSAADSTTGPDDAPDTGSDTGSEGNFGAPCEVAEDCSTGFCGETPIGSLCTQLCSDNCPAGWTCELVLSTGGGFLEYCMPAFSTLCRPCVTNDDCASGAGDNAPRCVDFGDSGAFCGGACGDVACPVGFACESRADVNGDSSPQCVPLTGACTCTPDAIADSAHTICARSNEFGRCEGERYCGDDGLTACDAPPPAAESCNGADDDCDGDTDEDLGASSCTRDSEFGSCAGQVQCIAGEFACDAAEPIAEVCNGLDDDCDGATDEDGAAGCHPWYLDRDDDGYGVGTPKCACAAVAPYSAAEPGDCADTNRFVHPGMTETCNGIDDNCAGGVDEPGSQGCSPYRLDADSDGFGALGEPACLCAPTGAYADVPGGDCNDSAADIHPNAVEICNGKDDNCDGLADPVDSQGCTTFWRDDDGDHAGVSGDQQCACKALTPYSALVDGDCDDASPGVKPGQLEVCNGVDDDCDGVTDGVNSLGCTLFWHDGDHDGFGATGDFVCACAPEAPYTGLVDGDCDDSLSQVVPGQVEQCNGLDDDCDGTTDALGALGCTLYYADSDGDGVGTVTSSQCSCAPSGVWTALQFGDCDDASADIGPAASEICNGLDDDCDSAIDEADAEGCTPFFEDGDGDGYGTDVSLCLCGPTGAFSALQAGDCDDDSAKAAPNRPELCNGVDDDCDGSTDEAGAASCVVYYADSDGDGFGVTNSAACLCAPAGLFVVTLAGDCDDSTGARAPNQPEQCNGVDDDCDGLVDEGCGLPVLGWPTYGADVRRTHQAILQQGPKGNATKWTAALSADGSSAIIGSPVIFPDGRVAAVTAQSLSLVGAAGAVQWSSPLPAPVVGAAGPTLRTGGTLIVGASDHVLLYAPSGVPLWDTAVQGGVITHSPIVDSAGRIYALTDSALTRLNPDGSVTWVAPMPTGTTSAGAPALNPNGSVLVATADARLVAFDSDSGEQLWMYDANAEVGTGALAIGATGIAYVGTNAGVRAASLVGAHLYSVNLPSAAQGVSVFNTAYACCVPKDEVLVSTAQATGLYKRSANLGSSVYQKPPASPWAAATDYDGDTYVTTAAGTLVRLDLAGALQWTFTPPDAALVTTPPAVATGMVVVGDSQGRLHARTD